MASGNTVSKGAKNVNGATGKGGAITTKNRAVLETLFQPTPYPFFV